MSILDFKLIWMELSIFCSLTHWSGKLDLTQSRSLKMCLECLPCVGQLLMVDWVSIIDYLCLCLTCGSNWWRPPMSTGTWVTLLIPSPTEGGERKSLVMLSPMTRQSLVIKLWVCGFLILTFMKECQFINMKLWEFAEVWPCIRWSDSSLWPWVERHTSTSWAMSLDTLNGLISQEKVIITHTITVDVSGIWCMMKIWNIKI